MVQPPGSGDLGEGQVAVVVEQVGALVLPLREAGAVGNLPAVGGDDVEVPVVVQVHRHGTPAPAADLDPGRRRRLGEAVTAAVDVLT